MQIDKHENSKNEATINTKSNESLVFLRLLDRQIGHDVRLDNGRVQLLRSLGFGVVAPHEQCRLEEEIEWDKADDEVGDALDDLEKREDDPVGQPQGVIFLRVSLDGLNALH